MKKLFILLIVFFLFFSDIKPLLAANSFLPTRQSLTKIWNDSGGNPAAENLLLFQLGGAINGVSVVGGGQEVAVTDSRGNVIGYRHEGGVLGSMEQVILAMEQKPGGVSSTEYLADMGHSLGIVPKEAYAQGTGFVSMAPVLTIWKKMRDFVYILYILVFFIVGFMILLRRKIDPRTVITVEAALPKLIISLILITFSYAIIGFMVDLANLASRVIGAFFVGTGNILLGNLTPQKALDSIFNINIFALIRPIGDIGKISSAIGELFQQNEPGLRGSAAHLLGESAVYAIFLFATLFITFKIFFSLLGPYVGIVLSIIFAPLQILMTAIPGNEASLGNWLKGILAKVAVFPVVFFLLLLAAAFGSYSRTGLACGFLGCFQWNADPVFQDNVQKNMNLIMPPFGNWGQAIGPLISFGILFTIPAAAQLVQNALKVKDQGGDIAQQTIMKGMSKVPGLKSLAER
jgi:hypothetical protein